MREVGILEAKTHFHKLLQAVQDGETVAITRRGKPVAVMSPAHGNGLAEREKAAREMKEARTAYRLGGLNWKKLRDEGRR